MALGSRAFYDFAENPPVSVSGNTSSNFKEVCELIRENVIGKDQTFSGPFGQKPIVYCDYIASGRSLKFIEDFIRDEVLPHYGNTHTTTSVTSLQTTMFRHESRDILRNALNASEHDAVIFVGHGCTGAVHKLINGLGLEPNSDVVVFVSNQEHHSNLLPWREIGAKIVIVQESLDGRIDLNDLEVKLAKNRKENRLMIGCFCAASNVTGILNDDLTITALLHNYGALSFWDYATAAPYVDINVNPKVPGDVDNLCAKDAVYFSMHKFIGGVQTPGVLVAKKSLFKNSSPSFGGGGGSVFFVTDNDHKYLKEIELREEAGTPAIVESIRAGLVMKLKQSVQAEQILNREHEVLNMAKSRLEQNSNFVILGNGFKNVQDHLPILSFMIRHKDQQLFLHHNFVCAVLNDVFGIQARGGCACSGPYAQHLMGMDQNLAKKYESLLLEDERLDRAHLRRNHQECSQFEILRPGFSRLNLSWFASDEEIEYVIEALEFVAEHAWKLMPQYIFNNETGEWRHNTNQVFRERKWLGNFNLEQGKFKFQHNFDDKKNVGSFKEILEQAFQLVQNAPKEAQKMHIPDQELLFADVQDLRWILLPSEAKSLLLSSSTSLKAKSPFSPISFKTSKSPFSKGSFFKRQIEQSLNLTKKNQVSKWLDFKPTKKNIEEAINQPSEEIIDEPEEPDFDACILTKRPEEPPKLKIKARWRPPTKDIFKPFLEAIEAFDMIKPGDKVLVCLSGGKDSLTLLHTMKQYQFYTKGAFQMGAMTIDPQSSAYDPRPLIPYLAELNVEYLYEEQDIMKAAREANCSSICAFCSRMKRGRMYAAARRQGYNVLALGQHLDDLAESFLMSLFHNGRLRTMKANYTVKERDLRIIRPFVYVREKQLRQFAEEQKLPVIPENCPACFENPKERHRTKQLLAQQELLFPRLYWSLKSAMHPVMNIRATGIESIIFGKQSSQNGFDNGNQSDEDE